MNSADEMLNCVRIRWRKSFQNKMKWWREISLFIETKMMNLSGLNYARQILKSRWGCHFGNRATTPQNDACRNKRAPGLSCGCWGWMLSDEEGVGCDEEEGEATDTTVSDGLVWIRNRGLPIGFLITSPSSSSSLPFFTTALFEDAASSQKLR